MFKPKVNDRELQARIDGAIERALQDVAYDLMGKAQRDAPLKYGYLRGSAVSQDGDTKPMAEVEKTPGMAAARVSFNTPYAAAQHEGMRKGKDGEMIIMGPPKKAGKRKFLEDNLKANAEQYRQHVANAIRKELS